jgi:hypothetical protein
MARFNFSIEQISVGPMLRLLKRSPAKQFDERRRLNNWLGRPSIHPYPPGSLTCCFSANACVSWCGADGSINFHAANAVMGMAH